MKSVWIKLSILLIALTGLAGCQMPGQGDVPSPEATAMTHQQAEPVKLLVVTGGHPYDEEAFDRMFDSLQGLTWDHYKLTDGSDVFQYIIEWDYDVVLLYNMTFDITPERLEHFDALLRMGVGLIPLHHGGMSYSEAEMTNEMYGIEFPHAGPFGFHMSQEFTYEIVEPNHPITQGMSNFDVIDETYTNFYGAGREGNTVLIATSHRPADGELVWVREYANGRVCTIQGGHDALMFDHPEFRRLLNRGILWSAGRLPEGDDLSQIVNAPTRFEQYCLPAALEATLSYERGTDRWAPSFLARRVKEVVHQGDVARQKTAELIVHKLPEAVTRDARIELFLQLERLRDPSTVDAMKPYLLNPEDSHYARKVLTAIGNSEAEDALLDAMDNVEKPLKLGMIESLGTLKSQRAEDMLTECLKGNDAEIATAATLALGKLSSRGALKALLADKDDAIVEYPGAWTQAVLSNAQALEGCWWDRRLSKKAYTTVWESDTLPAYLRAGALRAMTRLNAKDTSDDVRSALLSDDPDMQKAAIAALQVMPDELSAQIIKENYHASSPAAQQMQIRLAADRNLKSLAALVYNEALQSKEIAIRFEAIEALANLADTSLEEPFIQSLLTIAGDKSSDALGGAARETLTRLPDTLVDIAMIDILNDSATPLDQRSLIFEILIDRRTETIMDLCFDYSMAEEKSLRRVAIEGLGECASAGDMADLIGLLSKLESKAESRLLERSIGKVCARETDKAALLSGINTMWESTDAANHPILVRVIAAVATDEALEKLIDIHKDTSDEMTRSEALKALAEWPTSQPLEILINVALNSEDVKTGKIALNGALAQLGMVDAREASQKLAWLGELSPLVESPMEENLYLSSLSHIIHPYSLKLIAQYLSGKNAKPEAVLAVLELAEPLSYEYPRVVKVALEQSAGVDLNEEMTTRLANETQRVGEVAKGVVAMWTFQKDQQGWGNENMLNASVKDGILVLDSTGNDPFISTPVEGPEGIYQLKFRARTSDLNYVGFFYATEEVPVYGPAGTTQVLPLNKDGVWHEYEINIQVGGGWKELRMDPGMRAGRFEVDWMRLKNLSQQ